MEEPKITIYFLKISFRKCLPWFPGPILVHRTEMKIDFEIFQQSVKRYKKELGAVKLISSDDCEELYEGILSQTY